MFHHLWERSTVRKYTSIRNEILKLEGFFRLMDESQLQQKATLLGQQLTTEAAEQKPIANATLISVYALIREIIYRKLGLLLFATQVFGGIVLHNGNIAQMNTGEGKTLTALLPVCLNALAGKSVFVVTVNEYLASRDWELAKPVFDFIGINSGVNLGNYAKEQRKALYDECTVIYSTGSQLGFDYLNNNLATKYSDSIKMKFDYALIDEVDSILIDEAQNPLIISSLSSLSNEEEKNKYLTSIEIANKLLKGRDYQTDEQNKNLWLTETGTKKLQKLCSVTNFWEFTNQEAIFLIHNSLKALNFYKKGIEYIVDHDSKKIVIIDSSTGRLVPKRVYSSGIHQAIEVKEGLEASPRGKANATITYQNFFRLFDKISGMTGTAKSEAEEFRQVYGMEVIKVEPNKKLIRKDIDDLIFVDKRSRNDAVIKLVKKNLQTTQRPILIGSPSLEESEYLSSLFKILKIKHSKLNAVNHRQEAKVIADAGKIGSLTIATNMAGRGTDIILTPESIEQGGLLLIGLGRNLSRRLDDQLIGRAGRQGNPGQTQFYLSLEDDLLKNYDIGANIKSLQQRFPNSLEKPVSGQIFSWLVAEPQEKIRDLNASSREQTLNYDLLINKQRKLTYQYRSQVFNTDSVFELLDDREDHRKIIEYFTVITGNDEQKISKYLSLCNNQLKRIILRDIDNFWADYLQTLEKIRNMLAVKVYLPQDPQEAFFLESNAVFNKEISALRATVKRRLSKFSEELLAN